MADVMAMMCGWKVRTIPEITCEHLRPQGFEGHNIVRNGMLWGKKFYMLGYHPLYYVGQCLLMTMKGKSILCAFWHFVGFAHALIKGEPRNVNEDFIHFLRSLQMRRICDVLKIR